jgi:hypothetical protein
MFGRVVLAKVLPGAVEASFHRGDTGLESLSYFGMAPAFLNQRQQRSILRPQLRQGMPEGIQFLGVHRSGRLRDVFVLFPKRQKNAPQLLPAQLVDTGVAGQPEQPRLKLGRRLQTIQGSDHFDEDLLGQIFDVIASSGHGVNKPSHPMLVADDKLALGRFIALLRPADKVSQGSRRG